MSARTAGRLAGACALGLALALAAPRSAAQAAAPAMPGGDVPAFTPQSRLFAGMAPTGQDRPNPYSGDRSAIAEGQRLYDWFNCSGCHAGGGGGMGPALMDDTWIYGSKPGNLFDVIVEGRPNGMPSFGGRIAQRQIWQIIAYIESMGGMPAKEAENPRRSDEPGTAPAAGRK